MSSETGQESPASNSETPAQAAAEQLDNVVDTGAQTDGAQGEDKSGQERTFTQAEMDAILQKRLAKQERQLNSRFKETVQMVRDIAQPSQPHQIGDDKPRREQFANEDDWLDARDSWRDAQRDALAREQKARSENEVLVKKTDKLYAEAAKIPGFDADAFNEVLPELSRESINALIDSPVAPKLMAYIANNAEEVDRISKLSPIRQVAELGKLEDKLALKTQTTKAPTPLNGFVKGIGSGVPDLERADFATYKKLRGQNGARWASR